MNPFIKTKIPIIKDYIDKKYNNKKINKFLINLIDQNFDKYYFNILKYNDFF